MVRHTFILTTLLLFLSPALAQGQKPPELDWLAGCWQSAEGDTREVWSSSEDGYYFGYSVVFDQGQAVFFEQMRIDSGPNPVFNAYPRGHGPSAFPAIESSERAITFANAAHDFPQKIRYERIGETLEAVISKFDDSDQGHFKFVPCAPNEMAG